MKFLYILAIVFLLTSCNRQQNDTKIVSNIEIQNTEIIKTTQVRDTITNWQFYKDSELQFKSNILDSNRYTVKIKKSDKFKNLYLHMFHDFTNEIMKKRLVLAGENKRPIASFVDHKTVKTPFQIDKEILDKIRAKFGNIELTIRYSDPMLKEEITIGIIKFTDK